MVGIETVPYHSARDAMQSYAMRSVGPIRSASSIFKQLCEQTPFKVGSVA